MWKICLTFVVFVNSVEPNDEVGVRIIAGELAGDKVAPFAVTIWVGEKFACGGSIVEGSNRTILTAAHCLHNITVKDLSIGVGSNLIIRQTKFKVKSINIHPKFEFYTYHDIALIYLADDLTFDSSVATIQLSDEYIKGMDVVMFYGWGWTRYPVESPSVEMYQIEKRTMPMATCRFYWKETDKYHLCTSKNALGGACKGDSGGPLVKDGKQIGVLSFGHKKCGTYPDVFTRVQPYLKWINDNLQ